MAVGVAGAAAVVVAAWRRVQRDNSLPTDATPAGSPADDSPLARPKPTAAPSGQRAPGQALFSPSVSESSTKAELYEVAAELKVEGRSKMNKEELLAAIRAAG